MGTLKEASFVINGTNIDGNYLYKDYPTIIREAGLNHLDPKPDINAEIIKELEESIKLIEDSINKLRG